MRNYNILAEKIRNREPGIVTYGLTPPKINNPREKLLEISHKQVERIKSIDVDAIILYDIQDESDRNSEDRPFPFIKTVDPAIYSEEYLKEIDLPKIIYRCVDNYTPEELSAWIKADSGSERYSVFVGASSSKKEVKLSLHEAYDLARGSSRFNLGGVAIPERHTTRSDEHLRILRKQDNGCTFFVSQVTYNVEASKNFLSDYYYYCRQNGIDMVPILFTLTPCGSVQTLDFMKWLGISFPRWLENDLKHSEDILDKSLSLSLEVFKEILEFSQEKKIPVGCNIESVSVRKLEIEASIKLLNEVKYMFQNT